MKPRDLQRAPPRPRGRAQADDFVLVSSYWVRMGGQMEPRDDAEPDPVTNRKKFVLTKSVEENLRHLSRAALIGKYPVLLQGPTSAGKTSLISYLAARIGQKCVRINNHEHTDIQEYLGSYVSDSNGKLTFKEGVLVEAVRNGWWIILDELNLAPSEVLEALNRLLDDNRELFLPETQETVKPHPKFMLFATQNPPGLYGGRKVLSRAFRNRFLEIQVDEAPTSELQTILQERSSLPPSYCAILIDVMRQLQLVRQQSSIFAGKSGFITTRDLLRWAERRPATKQALAEEGYCLLAERLRKDDEKHVVKQVLEQKCNVTIDLEGMYYRGEARDSNLLNENGEVETETVWGSNAQFERVQQLVEQALSDGDSALAGNAAGLDKISVTKALRRLFALVGRCLQHQEPVLLVGETGCGKTTVCQLYSLLFDQQLHIINCHQHTETSDFLGCLRPVRGKEKIGNDLREALVSFLSASDPNTTWDGKAITELITAFDQRNKKDRAEDADDVSVAKIEQLKRRYQSIFEWCDGPLVESMKKGDLILVDEVNLAEDAVLERLNSVLEPSRTLLLAEKGGDAVDEIIAHPKWRIMATMNPGGDFGKRELSPALRNRFTEIWVPAISDLDDIATIIRDRLVGRRNSTIVSEGIDVLCDPILAFVKKFNEVNGGIGGVGAVTLRDILSWINFICAVMKQQQTHSDRPRVSNWTAFVQGAALSILDGLGLGSDKALHTALKARDDAYEYLLQLLPQDDPTAREEVLQSLHATRQAVDDKIAALNDDERQHFGIGAFVIPRGPDTEQRSLSFSLKAPTTMSNLYRVLRAMQVSRPIILEGSPGVGKTSLISALAAASGHRLVRINLSEQTDIADLFGSDLPAGSSASNGDASGEHSKGLFEWCDGVFLRALKAGDWVLLDELNLASQSVLEGLNSCLDHRGTVYIPELDREFECPPTFRVFAAQNPLRQGGGRKGLPKSFLNRFTRVFVDTLGEEDLIHIASSVYPRLAGGELTSPEQTNVLERMIAFNTTIHKDTMEDCTYGRQGAPWEFNLRDVFRMCELMQQHEPSLETIDAQGSWVETLRYYVNVIYVDRMRSHHDREMVAKRFEDFFGTTPLSCRNISIRVTDAHVQVGRAFLPRHGNSCTETMLRFGRVIPPVFNFLLRPMEALVHCVNRQWPALLVGPPASGKTSAVRLLAALTGNRLHELGMSASTDATELLGCFEQVDLGRKLRELRDHVAETFHVIIQALLQTASMSTDASVRSSTVKKARQLSNLWWTLTKHEQNSSENKTSTGTAVSSSGAKKSQRQLTKGELDPVVVGLLNDILTNLVKASSSLSLPVEHLQALETLQVNVQTIVKLSKTSASALAASFEWVDGTLLQAMERGEWILLDNVNFCSSSVLDRLNSLLETGGDLLINECGVVNGKLRVIKPHSNFRLFLAMDPQYGEVSRAMRNRCIEIALLPQDEQPRDLVRMAISSGVPCVSLARSFHDVHRRIMKAIDQGDMRLRARIHRRHLHNWALLTSREIERGLPVVPAASAAFNRVYGDDVLQTLQLPPTFVSQAFSLVQPGENQLSGLLFKDTSTFKLCHASSVVMLHRDVGLMDHLIRAASGVNGSADMNSAVLEWLGEARVGPLDGLSELDIVEMVESWSGVNFDDQGYLLPGNQSTVVDAALTHVPALDAFAPVNNGVIASFVMRRLVSLISATSSAASVHVTEQRLLFVVEQLIGVHSGSSESVSASVLMRFLRSLMANSVYASASNQMRESLLTLQKLMAESKCRRSVNIDLEHLPVMLKSNAAAFEYVQALVAKLSRDEQFKSRDSVQEVWYSILLAQGRYDIATEIEWMRFAESSQYEHIDSLFSSKISSDSSGTRTKKRQKATSSGFDGDLSRFSVLQQSYAVHQHHADRSSLSNDLVFLIFPFLKSIDAWLDLILEITPSKESTMRDALMEVTNLAKRLARDRYEFTIQLRVQNVEWMHFLIHWQYVKKSLNVVKQTSESLAGVAALETAWENVMDMKQRIDDAIQRVIGCTARKNTLWKRGGHALLPRSGDLWNARFLLGRLTRNFMELHSHFMSVDGAFSTTRVTDASYQVDVLALLFGGVASMEAAMKSGQLDVSSLFFVDSATRREVLHALCAFSYISKQQQRKAETSDKSGVSSQLHMANELVTLPDVLLEKLEKRRTAATELVQRKALYLSELEDTSTNRQVLDFFAEDATDEHETTRIGRDAPILLFDMREGADLVNRLVSLQLAPLREHDLARQELALVTDLVRVLNMAQLVLPAESQQVGDSAATVRKLVGSIQQVLRGIESLLDDVIELGLRNPSTYFSYQDIVWFGHAIMTSDWSDDELIGEAVQQELREFIGVVKSNLNGVLYGFHNFLRQNSFNDVERIALEVFDTQNKMRQRQRSKARKGQSDGELLEHTRVVPGWPRLLQSVGSAVMLRNIAEVAVNDSSCATIETQVRLMRMQQLKDMLRRGDGTIRDTLSEPLVKTIGLLQELFVATLMAFESTIEPASWQVVCGALRPHLVEKSGVWSLSANEQKELLRALRSSRDETFVQLVDHLVAPLLRTISIAASNSNDSKASSSSYFAVGEGLVLLGLWRFLLLIPSSPVDPVTKPIIKKEMLMARVAMLALSQMADSAMQRTTPQPVPVGHEKQRDQVMTLTGEVRQVAAYAIQRFNPEVAVPRVGNASKSQPTQVSISAFGDLFRDLLRFQKTIMPSEKLLGMLTVVRSGLTNQSKSRQVLRELEMFQGTTESFLLQLEKKFAPSFYDIVEPVAAAGLCCQGWCRHDDDTHPSHAGGA
ncbi:hypothetical protein PINS_up014613 [Pythium insidiosum]|nr:hypothetical protein PINS_up014613 [Pythium insidiosum]